MGQTWPFPKQSHKSRPPPLVYNYMHVQGTRRRRKLTVQIYSRFVCVRVLSCGFCLYNYFGARVFRYVFVCLYNYFVLFTNYVVWAVRKWLVRCSDVPLITARNRRFGAIGRSTTGGQAYKSANNDYRANAKQIDRRHSGSVSKHRPAARPGRQTVVIGPSAARPPPPPRTNRIIIDRRPSPTRDLWSVSFVRVIPFRRKQMILDGSPGSSQLHVRPVWRSWRRRRWLEELAVGTGKPRAEYQQCVRVWIRAVHMYEDSFVNRVLFKLWQSFIWYSQRGSINGLCPGLRFDRLWNRYVTKY